MNIRVVKAADLEKLIPLIAGYQESYGAKADPGKNRQFFGRFCGGDNPEGIQFIAEKEGQAVGFATMYFLPSSTSAQTYPCLNDLYTVPEMRGRGIGRALIEHCRDYAGKLGFRTIEWQTRTSNFTAQKLYDSLKAEKTAWYTYSLPTHAAD